MNLTDWRCASMHDPARRRGVWYRHTPGRIEIRAGREGDDASVVIEGDDADKLADCLDFGAQMQEDHGPDIQ